MTPVSAPWYIICNKRKKQQTSWEVVILFEKQTTTQKEKALMKTKLPANLLQSANIENKTHFSVRPKKIQFRNSTQRNGKEI